MSTGKGRDNAWSRAHRVPNRESAHRRECDLVNDPRESQQSSRPAPAPQTPASSASARETPWYLQWWFIVVALLVGSWLGLIPLWLSPLPTKKTKITLTLVLVLLQVLFFCTFFALAGGLSTLGLRSAGPAIPDSSADMSFASVEGSTREGQVLLLSLRADPEEARKIGRPIESSRYSAAEVRVDENTSIINGQTLMGFKEGKIEDLLEAEHVDVWFTGVVAESDPVQATAGTIVIGSD